MANAEHVEIALKGDNGADLSGADLSGADLSGADLYDANLRNANLSEANLREANLSSAELSSAVLKGADLSHAFLPWGILTNADLSGANLSDARLTVADLSGANLREANLNGANLSSAILTNADLSGATLSGSKLFCAKFNGANLCRANLISANLNGSYLTGADLSGACLRGATFDGAKFDDANLNGASIGWTVFANTDLQLVKSLASVKHIGPSYIGNETIVLSQGAISKEFLRDCGLQPWEILMAKMHDPTLTPSEIAELQKKVLEKFTQGPLFFGGVFISYSHDDDRFVEKLRERLLQEGVTVWLDGHDVLKAHIKKHIAEATRFNDLVLLILSESSIGCDWIVEEIDLAHKRRDYSNRDGLCLISIDEAWKTSDEKLSRKMAREVISDFSAKVDFEAQFRKFLEVLKLCYPAPSFRGDVPR